MARLTQAQKTLEARLARIALQQAPAALPLKDAQVWARASARVLRETLELHVRWLRLDASADPLRTPEKRK